MTTFTPPPSLARTLGRLRSLAPTADVYVVGGTVRDVLLGRSPRDLDLAVPGDARGWTRRLAAALNGHFVALDDERDVARIVLDEDDLRHIDVAALRGTIDEDLRLRDFTIDAMAVALGSSDVIDPCGGLADLRRRLVRMTSPDVLDADPLRPLRGVRIAAELRFAVEPTTEAAIRTRAAATLAAAAERRRDELMRIFAFPEAEPGLRLLDAAGLLDVLLPEVAAGKGVEQPKEHAYDVFEHNVRTVGALDMMLAGSASSAMPWAWETVWDAFGWRGGELRRYFTGDLSEGYSRGALLRLAGLLHDVAKPRTRARQPDGRVRFFGHAEEGARIAAEMLRQYRFPGRDAHWVALLVEEHLRPVQLAAVGEVPTRRALYRFFRDLGDAAEAALFLSLADAFAARGPMMTRDGWRRQVAYMNGLLVRSSEDAGIVHPPRLLTGYDIMSSLNLSEGPAIGRLLAAVEEAQAAGDIRDREGALAFVKDVAQQQSRTPDTSR